MKPSNILSTAIMALLALMVVGSIAFGQDLKIKPGSSFLGTGTTKVKGNIDNSTQPAPVTIPGTIRLIGAAQDIGAAGGGTLRFGKMSAQQNGTAGNKTMIVALTVDDSLNINVTGGLGLVVGANTLNIDGTSGIVAGVLNAGDGGSTVNYRSGGASQVVLGQAYGGTLGMSGVSTKTLSTDATAVTLSHSVGALTVNNNLTLSGAATIGTLADVSSLKKLDLGTTASIATVSGNQGTIEGGSGLTTIADLDASSGIISGAGGGNITFTNQADNTGAITGGAGLITFSGALNTATGTLAAGAGGMKFDGLVTKTSGLITAATGTSLDFNANVDNQGGAISLAGTGAATFAGSFVTSGTLTLASGSTWTYDGNAQDVAGGGSVAYGILKTTGAFIKTALGDITAVDLNNGGDANDPTTLDMGVYALAVSGNTDNTSSTIVFGGETNGFAPGSTTLTAGTITYSRATTTQTIAPGSYYQLSFLGVAPKNLANAAAVTTGAGVSLGADVIVNIGSSLNLSTALTIQGGGLTLAANSALTNNGTIDVTGNLDNSGALTNNGEITVQ